MDGRFWGNQWNPHPYHGPRYCSVPVHHQPAKSPKVISIPVQFVEAEPRRSEPDAAVKIQAAFRGFLVRKYMKMLAAMRREVEKVERRVAEEETVELMRREDRERLKVNEALMSLLFRLDSVRGVDSGVRECRKKVIRKAIELQEKVDAIVAAVDLPDRKEESTEAEQSEDRTTDGSVEGSEHVVDDANDVHELKADMESSKSETSGGSQSNSSANPESLVEEVDENAPVEEDEDEAKQAESFENKEADEGNNHANNKKNTNDGKDNDRNREMLERMMEDNEKMMGMMSQLFERNERQTQLLSLLSQRVERLERAFLCEKLRRKKKRQAGGANAVDGERFPDAKKCGKKL